MKLAKILEKDNIEFLVDKKIITHNVKHIWVLWLQGEEHAPPLVQACLKSIKKHAPDGYTVTVISESNISEYITLPDHIQKNMC